MGTPVVLGRHLRDGVHFAVVAIQEKEMSRFRVRSRLQHTLWGGSYREYIVVAHREQPEDTHTRVIHYGPFSTRSQAQQQLQYLEAKENGE